MSKKMDHEKEIMQRREFGKLLSAACSGLLLSPAHALAQYQTRPIVPEQTSFYFAQLMYGQGMQWNPNPTAARSMMQVLTHRTSVAASPDRVDLGLSDDKLFLHPFLYMSGSREFDPLPEKDILRLRNYLEYGGFMLVDDVVGQPGYGFDKSFQRELSRIFPGESLAKLPQNHTVFQSYYLIDRVAGRKVNRPYLLGLDRGDRTILMMSSNDLAGAWAKDPFGKWINDCEPGGERQREMAIRLGVNIVLYALTINYKKDLIHVPFISERRRGKP